MSFAVGAAIVRRPDHGVWTAVSLALAYAVLFAVYATWAWTSVARGASAWPFVIAAPFAYLAVPLFFVSIWFLVAWAFRADRPHEVRLGTFDALQLFWHEVVTIAGNAPRMIFYRWLIPDPGHMPSRAPVLLLHGVLCNAGVWRPFMRWLANRGVAPVYTLSYGPPLASIESFAEQMASTISAIRAQTGADQVIVVAHSMGGLVARAYLKRYDPRTVARLITIATPHEGSVLAWLAFGQSMAQLRPGNAWLSELGPAQGESFPPIVSLWSWHDSMVAPQTSSRVDFAENVELAGIGHTALLRDREVFERVLEEIDKARASLATSRTDACAPTSGCPA
jgi:triacylglycerol esterase/lipase EstA (alpha/beta hydrolase family)